MAKSTKKVEKVVFENVEDYLNIFIEILISEAQEYEYPAKKLQKLCHERINDNMN